MYFFIGFVVFAQIGGRMLDRAGAKRPVVIGCVLATIGFALWAGKVTSLNAGSLTLYIVIAGAGMGLMLGPVEHRRDQPGLPVSYGEATGITQTVRNYGASLGFAILGTILINRFRSEITSSLTSRGMPGPAAAAEASKLAQLQGSGSGSVATIPHFIRADFASAIEVVLYGMAIIMGIAALVALRGLSGGVQQETPAAAADLNRAERLGPVGVGAHARAGSASCSPPRSISLSSGCPDGRAWRRRARRGVRHLVLAARDGEGAADLVGHLAAVDHLSGHDGLPSVAVGL